MSPSDGPRFAAGQVWRYRTRPGDEQSTLVVVEVTGRTVHIQLRGIRVRTGSGLTMSEMYLPIALSALCDSVTDLLDPLERAEFDTIRLAWLTGHDTRDKGEFTVPVDRFLELVDRCAPDG